MVFFFSFSGKYTKNNAAHYETGSITYLHDKLT